MSLLKQSSTAQPLVFLMVDSADHITPKTGLSPTVTLSKAGGSFASPSGAVTEIGNGWYKVAGNATDTATLGPLILHATGTGADPVDVVYDVVAFDPQVVAVGALMPATAGRTLVVDASGLADANVVKLGPSGSGTAQTARDIGASVLLSSGTGTGQIVLSSGQVTTGTNNDKSGYSLSQTFPTNFSALSITAGGVVKSDVDTIKTQAVTASGGITFPAATLASTTNITALGTDTITSSVIAASAYQGIVDSLLDELLSGHVTAGSVGVALTNSSTNATRLQTAMELDGSVYRFTTNALEQAPGGGAGTSEAFLTYDWDGITGEPAYCLLNALRTILNKKTQSPGYINVLKEDGATTAFQVPITTAVSPAVGVTETGVPAQ